jgi:hypothetical protein
MPERRDLFYVAVTVAGMVMASSAWREFPLA